MARSKPTPPFLHRGHPSARGLDDAWVFAEGAGDTVRNIARYRNVSSINGGTWVVGRYGRAVSVSGGTSLELESPYNIAAGDFTFRLVFHVDNWTGPYTCLVDKGLTSPTRRELMLSFNTNGDLNYAGIGTPWTDWQESTGMSAGQDWDLVLRRRGSLAQIFVDGKKIGNGTTTTGTSGLERTLSLGPCNSGGGTPFDGHYYLCEIWLGRALSHAEIAALHGDPFGPYRPRRRVLCTISPVGGPYRVACAQHRHTGAAAGQTFHTGQTAGQIDGRCG